MKPFNNLLKNRKFVIPNGICEVRYGFTSHSLCAMHLSFLCMFAAEGFLTALGMTCSCFFHAHSKEI